MKAVARLRDALLSGSQPSDLLGVASSMVPADLRAYVGEAAELLGAEDRFPPPSPAPTWSEPLWAPHAHRVSPALLNALARVLTGWDPGHASEKTRGLLALSRTRGDAAEVPLDRLRMNDRAAIERVRLHVQEAVDELVELRRLYGLSEALKVYAPGSHHLVARWHLMEVSHALREPMAAVHRSLRG